MLRERLLQGEEQPARPAEHGDVRPLVAVVVQLEDVLGDPLGLLPLVGDPSDVYLARLVLDPGHQPLVGIRALLLGELRDHHVRCFEDPRSRAEVRVERELRRGRAVRASELLREIQQVEQARAAPRVDVLVGVSHRGHGMPVAEHAGDQLRLGDVGVLVFVEQHRTEPLPVLGGHLRMLLDHLERQRDLIAEVDHPEVTLQLPEDRRASCQLDPLQRGLVRAVGTVLLQLLQPFLVERDDLVGRAPVVRGLVVQQQDVVDHAALGLGLHVLERHQVHDACAELGSLGGGEHPLVRLDAREHAVAVEQLGGEPVVVHDLRLFAFGQVELGKGAADPLLQVLGRLVRERQAEHVAGQHTRGVGAEPTGRGERQVHDARGHHRRLARPRAGDEHERLERPRDRTPLLLGRLASAHHGDDLRRIGAIRHDPPSVENNGAPCG